MPVQIKKGAALTSLNITPLIDVVFLLLVFFFVTARFEESHELPVKLPDAATARPLTEVPQHITIVVDRQGQFVLSNRVMNAEQLLDTLRQAKADNPTMQSARLYADEEVPYKHMVALMDICNRAGVDYTLAAEKPTE